MADDRQTAQNRLRFGQTTLSYTIRVLTLFLVHVKAKARLQKVMIIFKSQIGHATHVSWLTLAKESDYCGHWVVRSYFQQLIVTVRSRSCKKD